MSSMNQPGRARPGSVEYEKRIALVSLPAYAVRSYSSSTKPPSGKPPTAGRRSRFCVPAAHEPLVPVRPLPYCSWHEFPFGLNAAGVD
jgi:hypothetical protein